MRVWIIVGVGLAAIVTVLFLPPIPQDPAYHDFADRRRFLGIPNALNILSNAPFVLVGALGWTFLLRQGRPRADGPPTEPWERSVFLILFAGIGLTGLGSASYPPAPPRLLLPLPPPRSRGGADLVGALAWYALAKLFELLDAQIFAVG